MAAKPYKVTKIAGLASSERRAVAFMSCETDDDIDADTALATLQTESHKSQRRDLWSSFDLWIGFGRNDNRFHGWPNEAEFKNCIVFKWNKNNVRHRLYGFTCHPILSNARFQLCVLMSHRTKNERHTDPREKVRAERLRVDAAVVAVISMEFPDPQRGPAWQN